MILRTPRSTRTYTLAPYTTRFRSVVQVSHQARTLAVDRLGLAARPQLVIGRAQFGLGLCHAHAERHRGAVEFAHRTDETQRHQPGNGEKEAAISGACEEDEAEARVEDRGKAAHPETRKQGDDGEKNKPRPDAVT